MKKITLKKILFSIIGIGITLCFLISIIINHYIDKINIISENSTHLSTENTIPSKNKQKKNNRIVNLLILGIDNITNANGRSDCIIIMTLDNEHGKIKLSSIARDSYVHLYPSNNMDKINHAFAFNGAEGSFYTVQNNFHIQLDGYICVNFSSFPKIIDKIGGIPINVTADELKYINYYIESINHINNTNSPCITSPGLINADGTQALAYSRIRYTAGGDFKRTSRQRTILNQVIKKLEQLNIKDSISILDDLLPTIETNLNKSEIITFSAYMLELKDKTIAEKMFPCNEDSENVMINGIYYYKFDADATKIKIHDFIYK